MFNDNDENPHRWVSMFMKLGDTELPVAAGARLDQLVDIAVGHPDVQQFETTMSTDELQEFIDALQIIHDLALTPAEESPDERN